MNLVRLWNVITTLFKKKKGLEVCNENSFIERLLNDTHSTWSGTRSYDPLLCIAAKCSVLCTAPVSTWHLLLSSNFTWDRCLKMKYCCNIWAGDAQTLLTTIDRVQKPWVGDELFSTLSTSLPKVGWGKPLAAQPLLARIVLRRITFPSTSKVNLYRKNTPYQSTSFFPRTTNTVIESSCFPDHYTFILSVSSFISDKNCCVHHSSSDMCSSWKLIFYLCRENRQGYVLYNFKILSCRHVCKHQGK